MSGGSFFEMGGYAAFVWPSYGAAALLLAVFALAAVRLVKRRERQLADLERRKNRDTE
jgi:heme exporter protein D